MLGEQQQYSLNYGSMTDSQMNDYFDQIQKEPLLIPQEQQNKNQLQHIIQHTLQLEYSISIHQEELRFYQTLLSEKQSSIKKLKEKYNKKNSKVDGLIERLSHLDKKIKDVRDGYKKINLQRHQYSLSQNTRREQRLTQQQKKSSLYRKYCQLEETYSNILQEIEEFGQIETEANYLHSQNQIMRKAIDKIQISNKQMQSNQNKHTKDHLKAEINRLYEKIKATQKQDQQICHEYQLNRTTLQQIQSHQLAINSKNLEIDSLYHKIQKIKEDIKLRRWQKLQNQKIYNQILNEESDLKKELASQMEYRQSQKKIKHNLAQNFKIIDSEADQELSKPNERFKISPQQQQSSMVQSQQQFDELINRFHKIKSKSKSGTS